MFSPQEVHSFEGNGLYRFNSVPNSIEEAKKIKQFIADLCKWENSLNPTYVGKAREDIRKALGYTPRVLDPFAGGGAIPLDTLRLGCEVYASDYNPVAVLILKAVLEYPCG